MSFEILERGRRVRDSLRATGDHPQALVKLDRLVADDTLSPAAELALQNILRLIDAADLKGAKK